MQRRIDRLAAVRLQVFHHQVEQPIAGLEGLAVIYQLEARVQVAVMPRPSLHMLGPEVDLLEYLRVGLKLDQRSIRFLGRLAGLLNLEPALLERRLGELPLAKAPHQEDL